MPSKNDLSALKVQPKNTLVSTPKLASKETASGRKKAPEDKESELIGLKLTPKEKAHLQEKAGRIPLATFLKDYLRNQTDLLG